MPITPLSGRFPDGFAPSSSRRKSTLDFAAAQGSAPSDSSTVRDKIRQWQKQGGGVAHVPETEAAAGGGAGDPGDDGNVLIDNVDEEKEYATKRFNSFEKERMRTPATAVRNRERTKSSISSLSSRESQDKITPLPTTPTHGLEFDEDGDIKSSSRPKKRVISDGHWRKDRNVQKPTQTKESQPRRKNELLDQYVENTPPLLTSPRLPFTPYSNGLSSPPGSHAGLGAKKFGPAAAAAAAVAVAAASGHVVRRSRDLGGEITEGEIDEERVIRARRRERARSIATVRTALTATNLSDVGSGEGESKMASKRKTSRQSQTHGHLKSKSLDISKLQETHNNDSNLLKPKAPPQPETGASNKMKRRNTSPMLLGKQTSKLQNALGMEYDKVKDKEPSRKKKIDQKLFGKEGPPPAQPSSKGSNIEAWLSAMDDPPELSGFDDEPVVDRHHPPIDRGMTSSPVHSRRSFYTEKDAEDYVPYTRASLKKKGTKKTRAAERNKERAKAEAEKARRRVSPVTDPEPATRKTSRSKISPKEELERDTRRLSRRKTSPVPETKTEAQGVLSPGEETEHETRRPSRRKTTPVPKTEPQAIAHQANQAKRRTSRRTTTSVPDTETEPESWRTSRRNPSPGAKTEPETRRSSPLRLQDKDPSAGKRGKSVAPTTRRRRSVTPEERKSVKSRIQAFNEIQPAPTKPPWKKVPAKSEKEEVEPETTELPKSEVVNNEQGPSSQEPEEVQPEETSPEKKEEVASGVASPEQAIEAHTEGDIPESEHHPPQEHYLEPIPSFEFRISSPAKEIEERQPELRPETPPLFNENLSSSILKSPSPSITLSSHPGSPDEKSLTPNEKRVEPSPLYSPSGSSAASHRRARTPTPRKGRKPSSRKPSPAFSYIASPRNQSPIASSPKARRLSSKNKGRRSATPKSPLFAPTGEIPEKVSASEDQLEQEEKSKDILSSPDPVKAEQQEHPERVDSPLSGVSDVPGKNRLAKLHRSLEEALQDTVVEGALLNNGYEEGEAEEPQEQPYQGSILDRPPPLKFRRQGGLGGGGALGARRLSNLRVSPILSPPTPKAPTFETIKEDENTPQADDDVIQAGGEGLERRLTTHRELMSVLSLKNEPRSRSVRGSKRGSRRNKPSNTTVADILRELKADETKYMRELRTLVGGVIPVLLTSVVSEADSATTAGLFRPSANPEDDVNFTKPILAMGDWLKQLKERHRAIPLKNVEELLEWAEKSKSLYEEYLKSWRLGFQDVVINLALPSQDDDPSNKSKDADVESLYAGGMSQDSDGDVIDNEGVKVDVAFLLKRPLVRLKYLAKTFKGIDATQHSERTEEIAKAYQALVTEARKRSNEERARLEDEAAAAIDATRARSLKDLTPLPDVHVDKLRRVKARDPFGLSLLHTSGQQIDCECELVLRDNSPDVPPGGDLLICEVDDLGRWLLFPPIERGRASARRGDARDELVVMIRGVPGEEEEWKELLCFQADEPEIAQEWISMIGLSPVPPTINRSLSFVNRLKDKGNRPPPGMLPTDSLFTVPEEGSVVSSNVNIPIGESPLKYSLPGPPDGGSRPQESKDEVIRGPKNSLMASSSLRRSSALRKSKYGDMHRPSLHGRQSSEKGRSNTLKRDLRAESPDFMEGCPIRPPEPEFAQSSGQRSRSPSAEPPIVHRLRKHSPMVGTASTGEEPERETAPSTFDDILTSLTPTASGSQHNKAGSKGPVLEASAGNVQKRRSSSPLKNEYAPRPASRGSQSSLSTVDLNGTGTNTDSSDQELEDDDIAAPLPRVLSRHGSRKPPFAPTAVPDGFSPPVDFVFDQQRPPFKPVKSNAMVFYWDDRGSWECLHTDECILIVTGGLIEAYEMALAPILNGQDEQAKANTRPIVALELTPMVPIRRGTAVDISIRSPPTPKSRMQPGNNIMFRCRAPEECDKLYGYINLSRTNNPTYIALQNSRQQPFPAIEPVERQGSRRSNKGIFGGLGRSNSYRASTNKPPQSTSGGTESSIGTMATAFSAIKKFGRSKVFNLARSTLTSRQGSGSGGDGSQYSGNSSGSGNAAPETITESGIGLTNAKIRLYTRMPGNKWGDLGAARLTILPAETAENTSGNNENHVPESRLFANQYTPSEGPGSHRAPQPQPAAGPNATVKRIVVTAKNGNTLIDACLGESCFERVARTGIAVSVYEDSGVPKEGGVMIGNFKVYMIQMKSEAETAYTFSLVGKLRY
ncbi:hypothetical protein KEM56_003235 [Ascosphaera pollenicola]|nr:hypothetical protein KEM56_003235 [Ascosphaera pollenicola]